MSLAQGNNTPTRPRIEPEVDSQSEDEWNSDDTDSDSDTDVSDTEPTSADLEDPRASPDTHEPPPLPFDLVPINCPTDCLIMYPVTSGKTALLCCYVYIRPNEKISVVQVTH